MLRVVMLTVLAVDGVISAVLAAIFLPIHAGGVWLPVSALISGVVNALLVWAGLQWTTSVRQAAISIWTWLCTMAVMAILFSGPSGDVILGGPSLEEYGPLVLLVLGVAPAGIVLWRAARPAQGLR